MIFTRSLVSVYNLHIILDIPRIISVSIAWHVHKVKVLRKYCSGYINQGAYSTTTLRVYSRVRYPSLLAIIDRTDNDYTAQRQLGRNCFCWNSLSWFMICIQAMHNAHALYHLSNVITENLIVVSERSYRHYSWHDFKHTYRIKYELVWQTV